MSLTDVAILDDQTLKWTPCILHTEDTHRRCNIAPIADLPTAFSIERGNIKQNERLLWRTNALYLFTIYYQTNDFATTRKPFIANKFSWTKALQQFGQSLIILCLYKGTGGAAALLLTLHGVLKTRRINRKTLLGGNLFRQLYRKTMRIIQLENIFTRNDFLLALVQTGEQLIQQPQPGAQCLAKLLFLNA